MNLDQDATCQLSSAVLDDAQTGRDRCGRRSRHSIARGLTDESRMRPFGLCRYYGSRSIRATLAGRRSRSRTVEASGPSPPFFCCKNLLIHGAGSRQRWTPRSDTNEAQDGGPRFANIIIFHVARKRERSSSLREPSKLETKALRRIVAWEAATPP